MTSYRDLAIAAMDNHRLFYLMAENARHFKLHGAWEYWMTHAAQAQRELHVYLNWMIHHPARPAFSEGGQ